MTALTEIDAAGDPPRRADDLGGPSRRSRFRRAEYMNSTGIGLLVTLLVRAQRQRQRRFAFRLNDHYRQVFSSPGSTRRSRSSTLKTRRSPRPEVVRLSWQRPRSPRPAELR